MEMMKWWTLIETKKLIWKGNSNYKRMIQMKMIKQFKNQFKIKEKLYVIKTHLPIHLTLLWKPIQNYRE